MIYIFWVKKMKLKKKGSRTPQEHCKKKILQIERYSPYKIVIRGPWIAILLLHGCISVWKGLRLFYCNAPYVLRPSTCSRYLISRRLIASNNFDRQANTTPRRLAQNNLLHAKQRDSHDPSFDSKMTWQSQ